MADGMSEATRTREPFNAAIKEVCETFGIEKFHDEQRIRGRGHEYRGIFAENKIYLHNLHKLLCRHITRFVPAPLSRFSSGGGYGYM